MGRERFKTKVKKKTLAPEWGESFVFGEKKHKLGGEEELVLEVLDDDFIGTDALGLLKIPFHDLGRRGEAKWFPLEGGKGKKKATGEIQLCITVTGGAQHGGALNETSSAYTTSAPLVGNRSSSGPLRVSVVVNKARGLRAADGGKTSDPFVKVNSSSY